MAEVEVDTETGMVRIQKITAVVDPGTIINPMIVEGQIEGGVDMGAGMALRRTLRPRRNPLGYSEISNHEDCI